MLSYSLNKLRINKMKKSILNRLITISLSLFVILFYFLTGCSQNNINGSERNNGIIIDHTCTDISTLSDSNITQAKNMNIYFEHASVGSNIVTGLVNLESGDPRFDYSNFIDNARGNPGAKAKIDYFYASLTNTGSGHYYNPDNYDAMMMKFCYIDNDYNGFGSITAMFEYYRDQMNNLQSLFPDTLIIWWTMPICTTGNSTRNQYNNLVRNYCNTNNKMLFDIADIQSHDPDGNAISDGVGERMYPSYSSDGGHLNSMGAERVAKAFWIMAYKVANM